MQNSRTHLINEALALTTRLRQVKPFSLNMPMVGAAQISSSAEEGINQLLIQGRTKLKNKIFTFIRSLRQSGNLSPRKAQARFAVLKLDFNALLDQMDIFADVLTQRSEHETGIWMAGLDVLAEDALKLKEDYFEAPPLICYLDRGHGAAIRRARTRLPGGKSNPVAIIRVPRERMVSSGIASSLVHEVGHQGIALLELIPSLRTQLRANIARYRGSAKQLAWMLYDRWISEILSDFWSVASLGVGSTLGLLGVVSLPRYFVFRMNLDDPHPFPWIRVVLSARIGKALYPDPQWQRLLHLWRGFYPVKGLSPKERVIITHLLASVDEFVQLLVNHRPELLRGISLKEAFPVKARQPASLRALFRQASKNSKMLEEMSPALVFAMMGQARADGKIDPLKENRLLSDLLRHWALFRREITPQKKSASARNKSLREKDPFIISKIKK